MSDILEQNQAKVINMIALMDHYNQKTINLSYKSTQDINAYIVVPVNKDLFYQLNIWIIYSIKHDVFEFSDRIKGVDNFWLTQLLDDHKNKRIDISDFYFNHES